MKAAQTQKSCTKCSKSGLEVKSRK